MVSSPLNGAHIIRASRWAPTPLPRLNVGNVSRSKRLDRIGTIAELQKGKNTRRPRCLRVADKGLAGYGTWKRVQTMGFDTPSPVFLRGGLPGELSGMLTLQFTGSHIGLLGKGGHYGDE